MKKIVLLTIPAAIALAGCSSAAVHSNNVDTVASTVTPSTVVSVSTSATAPAKPKPTTKAPVTLNPVTVLRKIKSCKLPAGASVGTEDMFGDRMASCKIPDKQTGVTDSEDVTIYTNADEAALLSNLSNNTSDDENTRIDGLGFVISVGGVLDLDSGGVVYYVSPTHIANEVDGKVMSK